MRLRDCHRVHSRERSCPAHQSLSIYIFYRTTVSPQGTVVVDLQFASTVVVPVRALPTTHTRYPSSFLLSPHRSAPCLSHCQIVRVLPHFPLVCECYNMYSFFFLAITNTTRLCLFLIYNSSFFLLTLPPGSGSNCTTSLIDLMKIPPTTSIRSINQSVTHQFEFKFYLVSLCYQMRLPSFSVSEENCDHYVSLSRNSHGICLFG